MATKLTGRVVHPDDPDYSEARTNLNLYRSKFPGVIVFCQDEMDVLNALKYAREKDIPFRVRSGRHSYQNFSILNKGLVIDISEMTKVSVNVNRNTSDIEAGADLGHVYQSLWKYGRALPGGTEYSVGLAGLTLGGGIGYLSRIFGLTCDNLLGVRIVIPKGEDSAQVVEATRWKNRELFWACCGGGGGNFGIVTQFKFRVHPIDTVSIYRMEWDFDQLEKAYDAWQNWAPFTDEKLTSSIELHAKSQNLIFSEGQYVGSKEELKKLLKPLVKETDPRKIQIATVPFNKAFDYFNYPAGNEPAYFKRSGSFIYEPIPERGIQIMKKFLENTPNENASIWQQSLAGKVQSVSPTETAFYHRNALIAQEYNTTWNKGEDAKDFVEWVVALRKHMSPYTKGDYVNWPDLSIRDWPTSYYGENFDRLRKVKTRIDPMNVFNFKQSIPPFWR
ncbi:FAD-binding oxidoreductase [Pseudalkalibacillus sp. SCS-8]|uniref:FAD-dependent oxidoreductase n=1 Tax=Pseudalkalibacillus nanhaiensis TaxID=3115291 RepID=UPI0032D9BE3D